MNISDIATVRTGLVKARKEKSSSSGQVYDYNLLNLKCISNDGDIIRDHLEPYNTSDELKEDYLTHLGDVLVFQRSCFFFDINNPFYFFEIQISQFTTAKKS